MDNLLHLEVLSNETLLENLLGRFKNDKIYTYLGDILVSLNPYKVITELYSADNAESYRSQRIGVLLPHIFAIGDASFRELQSSGKNQSVIVSGESGAGKSECVKLFLQYLSSLSDTQNQGSGIEQMILESSPILEAFGNAKTSKNNNSSRFGKYMEIHFDERGQICGAKINQYLLEKTRVVLRPEGERSYHIFYQMIAGLSDHQKAKLHLKKAEDFEYLKLSRCYTLNDTNDEEAFDRVQVSMSFLQMPSDVQFAVWQVLAAILHMGNLKFSKADKGDGSKLAKLDELKIVAELLEVDEEKLVKSLTFKVTEVMGDKIFSPLRTTEAAANRDALVKLLYHRLFEFLIQYINQKVNTTKPKNHIGVLDIFGFENFASNSFEQFCINYTNEKLQQFFNEYIFRLEQQEYRKEGIPWSDIEFKDNQECIDLIEKKMGLIALLDEESKFPKGTDETLIQKFHATHEKNPYYDASKKTRNTAFTIKHFAGEVVYEIAGFLEKNRDTFPISSIETLSESKNALLQKLCDISSVEKGTTAGKFKNQLLTLVDNLRLTSPWYVRCIKPNQSKKPDVVEADLVLNQLRYTGMLETIKIRKMGYPYRLSFSDISERYRVVDPSLKSERTFIEVFLKGIYGDLSNVQIGQTKVFFKDLNPLDDARGNAILKRVLVIQATWRMFRVRRKFVAMKQQIVKAQSYARRLIAKKKRRRILRSLVKIQSFTRMIGQRSLFRKMLAAISLVQSVLRGRSVERRFLQTRTLGAFIIPASKALLARKQYLVARDAHFRLEAEKRELEKQKEEEMKRELEELQREEQLLAEQEMMRLAAEADRMREEEKKLQQELERQHSEDKRLSDLKNKVLERKKSQRILNELKSKPQRSASHRELSIEEELESIVNARPSVELSREEVEGGSEQLEDFLKGFDTWKKSVPGSANISASTEEDPLDAELNTLLSSLGKPVPKPEVIETSSTTPPPQVLVTSAPIELATSLTPSIDVPKVANLEVPADRGPLAHTKSSVKLARMPSGEAPPADMKRSGSDANSDAKHRILQSHEAKHYKIEKYAENNFQVHKTGTVRKKVVQLSTMASFSKKIIGPLHKLPSDISKVAMEIFNRVMSYMMSKTFESGTAQQILSNGLELPELRDEIYCQLVKQATRNPKAEHAWKIWELLTFCLSTFAPSPTLQPYLASYLFQTEENPRELNEILQIAKYCHQLLERITVINQRKFVPPVVELLSIRSRTPLVCQVSLTDGSMETIHIDSLTTAWEAEVMLVQKLGMRDDDGFRFFEIFTKEKATPTSPLNFSTLTKSSLRKRISVQVEKKPEYTRIERSLKSAEVVADSFAKADKLCSKQSSAMTFELMFKCKIFVDTNIISDDQIRNYFLMHQVCNQITQEKFPCKSEHSNKLMDLKSRIKSIEERSQREIAASMFLQLAVKMPYYGTTFFEVELKSEKQHQFDMGVSADGICFLNTRTKAKVQHVPYSRIADWFFSADTLEIVFHKQLDKKPVALLTLEAPEISSVIAEYFAMQNSQVTPGDVGSDQNQIAGDLQDLESVDEHTPIEGSEDFIDFVRAKYRNVSKVIDQKMITFSKDPITTSLLVIDDKYNEIAAGLFIGIMKFMGDLPKGKRTDESLAKDIIQTGIDHEVLRDEIYNQMFKQVRGNPKINNIFKGWMLVALAIGCFPPSKQFLPYFRAFVSHPRGGNIGKLTKYILAILPRVFEKTSTGHYRKLAPGLEEFVAIKEGVLVRPNNKPVLVRIHLFDKTSKGVYIDPASSIKELFDEITSRINLKDTEGFAICEETSVIGKIRQPGETENVCDLIANWAKSGDKKDPPKFVLRVNFFGDLKQRISENEFTADPVALDLLYQQAVSDVMQGIIPVTQDHAESLAAISVKVMHGDANQVVLSNSLVQQYLPKKYWKTRESTDLVREIGRRHQQHSGKSAEDAKKEYLFSLRKSPFYGSNLFAVEQHKKPQKLWLHVNAEGIIVTEEQSEDIIESWKYKNIPSFSPSNGGTEFTMTVGTLLQPSRRIYQTTQGSIICQNIKRFTQKDVNVSKQRPRRNSVVDQIGN